MARTNSARIALLISLILAALISPVPSALAGDKEPAPPKPAKPKGPASTFHFNQYGPSDSDDVVLRWDEQTLAAVRATKPAPTVVARALAVVHTAMYDAWAAYDAKALGTRTGASLRRPTSEYTRHLAAPAARLVEGERPARPADRPRPLAGPLRMVRDATEAQESNFWPARSGRLEHPACTTSFDRMLRLMWGLLGRWLSHPPRAAGLARGTR